MTSPEIVWPYDHTRSERWRRDVADDDTDDIAWDQPPDPGLFVIGLEGRRWNVDRFHALDNVLPEKFELIDGKLFWSERERIGLLGAMLEQVGLAKAVTLAPKELWLQALAQLDE
jgi:hypothetical protein